MSRTLLQLLRDNVIKADTAPSIRSETVDDAVHVYVYDVIDAYFGVAAENLIAALADAGSRPVHLHINSPGGDVFEARAMSAALVAHKGPVIAYIDGLAASAATLLALTASEVIMIDGGLFMVHNAMSLAYGNKSDMRARADLLEKVDGQLAADYVARTGKDAAQVAAWMDAETWFTAAEAKEAGFINTIAPNTKNAGAKAVSKWNLSAFANAPKIVRTSAQIDDAAVEAQLQQNRNRLRLLQARQI